MNGSFIYKSTNPAIIQRVQNFVRFSGLYVETLHWTGRATIQELIVPQ